MASYLISPQEETPWRMSRPDVDQLLKRLWPSVVISTPAADPPEARRAMVWKVTDGPHGWFGGSLQDSGQFLVIEIGDYEDIARLAFHVKQELGPKQALLLYDESYSDVIPLEDKSEEEILRALEGDR
jgi:hypothetical protein